tara:strand:+ start:28 stop:1068 length:1041 start_codon:yes stop_codon:yes gene_type:complete
MSKQDYATIIFSSGQRNNLIQLFNSVFDTDKLNSSISAANSYHAGQSNSVAGEISTLSIDTAGSGYAVGDNLHLSSDNGFGAVGSVATIDGSGGITDITINYGGMGYATTDAITISTDGSGSGAAVSASAVSSDSVTISDVTSALSTQNTTNKAYLRSLNSCDDSADFITALGNVSDLGTNWAAAIKRAADAFALSFPDIPQTDGTTTLTYNVSPSSLSQAHLNAADEATQAAIMVKVRSLESFISYVNQAVEEYYRSMSWQKNTPITYLVQNDVSAFVSSVSTAADSISKMCKEAELLYTMFRLGTFINEDNVANFKSARASAHTNLDAVATAAATLESTLTENA